jgi:SAM-dependent methyltransferase
VYPYTVQERPERLTRKKIHELFLNPERPPFLDFSPPLFTTESAAIKARSGAVEKGLLAPSLEEIADSHGSPPFSTVLSVCKLLKLHSLIPPIEGVGIEVGSGLALLSCALKKLDENHSINGIIALEATKPFVTHGIRLTSQELLGDQARAILPCYGVFEDLPMEDSSLDFGFQIESLHHADSLNLAISEISRIIRPGGYFVSIDRSWIDSVKQKTLEKMLDHEYSRDWLRGKNFNPDVRFTRRQNGEHEYRDREWIEAFQKNGFTITAIAFLHPKLKTWHVLKRFIGLLNINKLFKIEVESRPGILRTFVAQTLGIKKLKFSNLLISPHPRPLMVMILRKN